MDAIETCPQIELACGDEVTALVLRHLEPLSAGDLAQAARLRRGPSRRAVVAAAQGAGHGPPAGRGRDPELAYALPEFGITMPFKPTDFTQVNPHINRVLVSRALRLLDAQPEERVIDWFCGLGNFTLPIATRAREVLGIEGSETLVARSRENYERNNGPRRGQAGAGDDGIRRAQPVRDHARATGRPMDAPQRWLVDPPREGAFALAKAMADLHQQPELRGDWTPPQRIVYVSCNPATLARDAGLLVHQAGYRCTAAGVVNMFPHTAHVESHRRVRER